MENTIKKCKNHPESDSKIFCQECKMYMCNKCENYHSKLFGDHNSFNSNININEIFTGNCKEIEHNNKLKYYCKNHNILCCEACITKIKGKGNGQHTDCDICFIENIKDDKKKKLKENLKLLKDLSKVFSQSYEELKTIGDKMNTQKENLIKTIQNIFTKIRNALNNREDEILDEVNKKFNELYFNENILKESQKMENEIKINLEKGKNLDNEWDSDNKLISVINDCINIEKNINSINIINENIKKCKSKNTEIKFNHEEDINKLLMIIKNFGYLYHSNEHENRLKYKICLINLIEKDNALLITNDKKSSILYGLLKLSVNNINIELSSSSFLSTINYEKIKKYKIVIYDLKDGGYCETKNAEEVKKYVANGGNVIVTHDQWNYGWDKNTSCMYLFLRGKYDPNKPGGKEVNKAKILKKDHPIFNSFYSLQLLSTDEIEVTTTHRNPIKFENVDEYNKNMIIELNDGYNGYYLLIKGIEKGKIIYWNAGHKNNNLNDFEKKLFINIIHWIYEN